MMNEPLSAITDDYFKAIIRAVLDDQMDLETKEFKLIQICPFQDKHLSN